MRLPKVPRSRLALQIVFTILVAAIGVQFALWVRPHLAGSWPRVARPPGVEAFLPIDAMLALRHLLGTGQVDAIHPAGLGIFLGVCLASLLVARSFCSHLCPIGFVSEWLGRSGRMAGFGASCVPRWVDVPLRGVKYLLLGFFAWAVWWAMDPEAVARFLDGPYARVVDVKMWLLFARPSTTTLVVLAVLALASLLLRDAWCRYLCPYGALLGLLGRLAPLKVSRDPDLCTACQGCTAACPARLPVHTLTRVRSAECTSCQDCVLACPASGCLEIWPPTLGVTPHGLRPATVAIVVLAAYLGVVVGFRLTGHWRTTVTEAEYHRRIQEIDSPIYTHATSSRPGAMPEATRPGS